MTRVHFDQPIYLGGVFTPVASVRVLKPGTTTPIVDPLYAVRSGGSPLSQPLSITDGNLALYVDYPQTVRFGITPSGGSEVFLNDRDIGAPYGDENILTYECRPVPGYDNYDALTEALFTTMTPGDWRYIPRGVFQTSQTPLYPAHLDGWLIRGPGPGGTNRLPPAVIQAMPGHTMPAGLAPPEWWYSDPDGHEDTGQGWCMKDFGLDGGGFSAGRGDTSVIETTSRWLHGLVLHGSGSKVLDIMVVSANGHGITQQGKGRDTTTVLGESHETKIDSCGSRWTGLAGIHTGLGQQDGIVSGWCKCQNNGTYNIHHEDVGWLDLANHPSWSGIDSIVHEKGWQSGAGWNYVGSVGKFQDGSGNKRYGIRTKGDVTVADNMVNTNAPTPGQSDHIVGYRVETGAVNYHDNRLIYGAGDTVVLDEQDSLDTEAKVHDNTKRLR